MLGKHVIGQGELLGRPGGAAGEDFDLRMGRRGRIVRGAGALEAVDRGGIHFV